MELIKVTSSKGVLLALVVLLPEQEINNKESNPKLIIFFIVNELKLMYIQKI